MIKISVIDAADQQMGLILNNRRVTLRLRYNVSSDRWAMNFAIDDKVVLYSQRVVPGIDLLAPFNFGVGKLFAITNAPDDVLDRNVFIEERAFLFHCTDEEYEAMKIAAGA